MSAIPKTQKASILQEDFTCAVETIPVELPGPGKVLVRVTAAAQNPTDWKSVELKRYKPGQGTGVDFAGVVAAVGDGVTNVKVGERVAGWCRAEGYNMSSFREYTIVNAHPLMKTLDNISDEQAATLPLGVATAALGLRRLTNYPQAAPYNRWVLVWGGASSVGLYAVQLARLTNYKVIATASPKNHALVKSHGADVVIDYRAPDVVEQIINATGRQGGVDYVYDAISEGNSVELSVKTLRPTGPRKIGVVLPLKEEHLDPSVEYTLIFASLLLGVDRQTMQKTFVRDERDYQFGIELSRQIADWVREGILKPNPYTIWPGGLAGVQDGLTFMKEEKFSGTKIVYRIADTP